MKPGKGGGSQQTNLSIAKVWLLHPEQELMASTTHGLFFTTRHLNNARAGYGSLPPSSNKHTMPEKVDGGGNMSFVGSLQASVLLASTPAHLS